MRDVWEKFRRESSQEKNAINAINLRYRYYDDTQEDVNESSGTYDLLQKDCAPLEEAPEKPINPDDLPDKDDGSDVIIPADVVPEELKKKDCECPSISSPAMVELAPLITNEINEKFTLSFINFNQTVYENNLRIFQIIEELDGNSCSGFCKESKRVQTLFTAQRDEFQVDIDQMSEGTIEFEQLF